jgi:cell division topological specificity factor
VLVVEGESTVKFLNKLFGHDPGGKSKQVAKERLKLALTYDRSGLSQSTIEQLRDEILLVIAKHLKVRIDQIDIRLDHTAEQDKLVASIPLRAASRSRAAAMSVAAQASVSPSASASTSVPTLSSED